MAGGGDASPTPPGSAPGGGILLNRTDLHSNNDTKQQKVKLNNCAGDCEMTESTSVFKSSSPQILVAGIYTIFSVKTTGWYCTEDDISFYRNVCKMIAKILTIIFSLRLCKVGNLWFGKGLL